MLDVVYTLFVAATFNADFSLFLMWMRGISLSDSLFFADLSLFPIHTCSYFHLDVKHLVFLLLIFVPPVCSEFVVTRRLKVCVYIW